MNRTAACSCGQLTATCAGDPDRVVLCSCTACQRRTGSPFGAGAYYLREKVKTAGRANKYRRQTDGGRWFDTYFCPDCGTSLYWFLELFPTEIGVAVGGFGDPSFPPPVRSVWAAHKHQWIEFPEGVDQLQGQSRT